jgi:hypothetical protein
MPTTQTLYSPARTERGAAFRDQRVYSAVHRRTESKTLLSGQADAIVEAPTFIQVYLFSPSGFGAHGLLKSVSRGGLQVLTPIAVPVGSAVEVTVSGCEPVPAEVFYCVKKLSAYQVGIVFSTRQKPEAAVGSFSVISELDEPFTVSRGHIVDAGSNSISILCKTAVRPQAWVRVESNGWVLFGEVEGVLPTSMLASCVGIHLDAAFRARSNAGLRMAQAAGEGVLMRSSYGF